MTATRAFILVITFLVVASLFCATAGLTGVVAVLTTTLLLTYCTGVLLSGRAAAEEEVDHG